jgi:hypothetical protein
MMGLFIIKLEQVIHLNIEDDAEYAIFSRLKLHVTSTVQRRVACYNAF